jgi:hypothetical protein
MLCDGVSDSLESQRLICTTEGVRAAQETGIIVNFVRLYREERLDGAYSAVNPEERATNEQLNEDWVIFARWQNFGEHPCGVRVLEQCTQRALPSI